MRYLLFLLLIPSITMAQIIERDYGDFQLRVDCARRGAMHFSYMAKADTGNHKRSHRFKYDPDIVSECQQTSLEAYGDPYDRGHMVPANHMDGSKESIYESNYITNIWPQHKAMNRGAWLETEMITECMRDKHDLAVEGGPLILGSGLGRIESHGVTIPNVFWKVIQITQTGEWSAWVISNTSAAKRGTLKLWKANIDDLIRWPIPYRLSLSRDKYRKSAWQIPKGCERD